MSQGPHCGGVVAMLFITVQCQAYFSSFLRVNNKPSSVFDELLVLSTE